MADETPQALTPEQREDRRMHLDHLQGIIGRLSQLGFMMKGWAITFVGGLFALSGGRGGWGTLLLSLGGIVIFWYLDAWLITLERRFISRYEDAAKRWDDALSLSSCLDKPAAIDFPAIAQAGKGFTRVCYIALIVAALVGWIALSPK